MLKASVFGEVLGTSSRRVARGLRGRHVAKDHQRKLRTSGGSPRHRRTCTARASHINRSAAKLRCARNWGGWGRLSVEGPGQKTRTGARTPGVERQRSLEWRRSGAQLPRHRAGTNRFESDECEGGTQTRGARQLGASLGKAPSERPALKPYWGKPAVRNFRGGDGNVGIIRSPVRAIALPDSRHEWRG